MHVLVNNAGVLHDGPLLELTDAQIAESVAVHLTSPIRLGRSLVPSMVAGGFGRIVNVSSGWGFVRRRHGRTRRLRHHQSGDERAHGAARQRASPRREGERDVSGLGADAHGRRGRNPDPGGGADTAVWLATLPDDVPTGGFFRDRRLINW